MINKVSEINIEQGFPTVDSALMKLKNALTTFRGQGCKAVIVIHGFGSSGTGGGIKSGVQKVLSSSGMKGIVRGYCAGEDWVDKKRDIISHCQAIQNHERRISGNQGVTVVLLR